MQILRPEVGEPEVNPQVRADDPWGHVYEGAGQSGGRGVASSQASALFVFGRLTDTNMWSVCPMESQAAEWLILEMLFGRACQLWAVHSCRTRYSMLKCKWVS